MIVGVDQSINCTAICFLADGERPLFQLLMNTNTGSKVRNTAEALWQNSMRFKDIGFVPPIVASGFETKMQKYAMMADRFRHVVQGASNVYFEGAAYAAKGMIFDIAEYSGILKYECELQGIYSGDKPIHLIKKLATGKGNAKKIEMVSAFFSNIGEHDASVFEEILSQTKGKSHESPISDIADSYYIARFALVEI